MKDVEREIGIALLNGFIRNYDKLLKYNTMIGMLDIDDDPEVIRVIMKKRDEALEIHRNYAELISKGDLPVFPEISNYERTDLLSLM